MSESKPLPQIERNPITHARHRKEVLWQIFVPLAIVAIFLLSLAIYITQAGPVQTSRLADISLMFLITPTIIMSILGTIFMIAGIYATVVILNKLPIGFRKVDIWLKLVNQRIGKASNAMVEPIIRVQSFGASIRALKNQFRRR